jgi:hypothetical protein
MSVPWYAHIIRNALSVGPLLAGHRTEPCICASRFEGLAAAFAGSIIAGFAAPVAAISGERFGSADLRAKRKAPIVYVV